MATLAQGAARTRVLCSRTAPASHSAASPAPPRLVDVTRRQLLAGSALGSLCTCCPPMLAPPPARADGAAGPWGYSCAADGPASWEGPCAAGVAQSPVNIPLPLPAHQAGLEPIKFQYPRFLKGVVTNPGHGTMQVAPTQPASCLIGGQRLQLLQWHFHSPAEHALSGRRAAMEAHFVHRNPETGSLAVLAVLLQHGGPANACLDAALRSAPAAAGGPGAPLACPVSLLALLPRPSSVDGRRPYATYRGSLTTPPCSEGVDWYVFLEPVKVSADQVLEFQFFTGGQATLGSNARPLQPLGDRQLRYFS